MSKTQQFMDSARERTRENLVKEAKKRLATRIEAEEYVVLNTGRMVPYRNLDLDEVRKMSKEQPELFEQLCEDKAFRDRVDMLNREWNEELLHIDEKAEDAATGLLTALPETVSDCDFQNGLRNIYEGQGLSEQEIDRALSAL